MTVIHWFTLVCAEPGSLCPPLASSQLWCSSGVPAPAGLFSWHPFTSSFSFPSSLFSLLPFVPLLAFPPCSFSQAHLLFTLFSSSCFLLLLAACSLWAPRVFCAGQPPCDPWSELPIPMVAQEKCSTFLTFPIPLSRSAPWQSC